jgi:hypothetical protein
VSKPTHFRCRVYGLLSVAQCHANRGMRERLGCNGCTQAPEVDRGAEPSLTTLEALVAKRVEQPAGRLGPQALPEDSPMASAGIGAEERSVEIGRQQRERQAVRKQAARVPPVERTAPPPLPEEPRPEPVHEGGAQREPAPAAKGAHRAIPPGSSPPVPRRIVRLLRDLAARRIGLPAAVARARTLLKTTGRVVPRDSWEGL